MRIVQPYAHIVPTPELALAMRRIEWAARISHRSEEQVTPPDSWRRFIETVVLQHGDWSVVEHVSVTVDMLVDRGITHEWVRHRLFGFTQESTRFVNYEKKMPPSFIYPQPDVKCKRCLDGNEVTRRQSDLKYMHFCPDLVWEECTYDPAWLFAIATAEAQYKNLLAKKWRPQEARSVFPNALASRIVTTGNLRNWRHVLTMRTTAEAHPQMRQVTIPLLAEFQETFPLLFDDIVPNQKQSEAIKKAR